MSNEVVIEEPTCPSCGSRLQARDERGESFQCGGFRASPLDTGDRVVAGSGPLNYRPIACQVIAEDSAALLVLDVTLALLLPLLNLEFVQPDGPAQGIVARQVAAAAEAYQIATGEPAMCGDTLAKLQALPFEKPAEVKA